MEAIGGCAREIDLLEAAADIGSGFRRVEILQPKTHAVQPDRVAIDDAGPVGRLRSVSGAEIDPGDRLGLPPSEWSGRAEVLIARGQTTPQAAKAIGVTEQTYYRWRREYGGMKVDQAKRLKALERENQRLRRAVSDLTLDKMILEEVGRGKF
ncbi:Transposase [Jannaschia aquimarina]|uniref:Transposase n=1 Tax=Jannaschia aquimarina TaxID=935700 RepID=A0A0D1D6H2_9RHOB|nr:Transposase [Jannaschia aquimarina]SNT27339.1 Transposase [Jannaschia aquimarina]